MYTKPIVFSVESKLFQSIWLYGLIGAISILLVALFFNNRYNNLIEKSNRDRNSLIRENKMLTLQQKSLQLQMNPHFVFNALNSIQGLIAKNDNQKARRYLQEFSVMMRSVLNQSREETIFLSDEVDYLKSYLNLEKMANNDKFDWEVIVDTVVEDDIKIPTMIIQPFVENAIVHGVKSLKDRRGKVQVVFQMNGTQILCKVTDNGIGRTAAGMSKSSSHKSVAIEVAKERLSTKMSDSRDQPIRYRDVFDANNIASGTEVIITIPIMN
jgi:LytS/YehU family sensor histidine kinase